MADIPFWNQALHLGLALVTGLWDEGWKELKALKTCPHLCPKAGQGVCFLPEFQKIGKINVAAGGRWCRWRFQMANVIGGSGSGIGASQHGFRQPAQVYESC